MFDMIKEKLAEAFGGATEQLGVNPEDIASQINDATGQLEELGSQAQEAKDSILPGGENK